MWQHHQQQQHQKNVSQQQNISQFKLEDVSKYKQEETCALLKFQVSSLQLYQKRDSDRGVSCEIIKSKVFIEHLRMTASGRAQVFTKNCSNS